MSEPQIRVVLEEALHNRPELIKAVYKELKCTLVQAIVFVDSAPCTLLATADLSYAQKLKTTLEAAGGNVRLDAVFRK